MTSAVAKQQGIDLAAALIDMEPYNKLGEFWVPLKMRRASDGTQVALQLVIEPQRALSSKRKAKGGAKKKKK